MALVIKKRVGLEFLGTEYKDAYIVFQSIPARDLPDIIELSEKANSDTKALIPIFIQVLEKYFLTGEATGEAVVKEDIGQLDAETILHCFKILTGQDIDPKVETPLTSSSPTVE